MEKSASKSDIVYDVLIVGGGVSGLFSAWRLLKNSPNLKIRILEKMDRTGGRLQTTTVPITGKDGITYDVRDEEGGMRFVPKGTGMEHLWKLIGDMNASGQAMKTVDFVMGDENNRYYIRGKSFTQKRVSDGDNAIWSSLFNLASWEEGKNPSSILQGVMDDILAQNNLDKNPANPTAWIQFRNTCTYTDYEGHPVPINQWGFWSILRRYGLSEECITMLDHVLGFMGPFQAFINAGAGLQILFDFPSPKETHFQTLADGFESLPTAIANEVTKMGGAITLGETVHSISKNGDLIQIFGEKDSYMVKKLILAIPKKPLKQLVNNASELLSGPAFLKGLNSVKDMELTKVGLYFKERWWHSNPAINLTNGPNFTDLPMGSMYAFSQYPEDTAKDKQYNGPAALTQYTDYDRGNFWKELHNIGEMYQTPDFPENPPGTYPASRTLVNELMKQLKQLFGLKPDDTSVPMPVLCTYRVWGQAPFGYGYHQYKINVDDKEVYKNIWNPAENIYVCNESWSPEQGWVEGALIMSDLVTVKGFGLEPYTKDGGGQNPVMKAQNLHRTVKN